MTDKTKAIVSKASLTEAMNNPTVIEKINNAIPEGIRLRPERLFQMAIDIIKDEKLAVCTHFSVMECIMQVASTGLELSPYAGHVYLVPYNNTKLGRKEAQVQIGYKGLIQLARNDGVMDIRSEVVYENDYFNYMDGINPVLEHRQSFKPLEKRGKKICAYAIATLPDKTKTFKVMGIDEILKYKERSQAVRAGKKYNFVTPWDTDEDWMIKKTVLRQLCKLLPLGLSAQEAVNRDEQIDYGLIKQAEVVKDTQATSADELAEKLDAKQAEVVSEVPFEAMTTIEELELWIQEYTTENDIPDSVVSDAVIDSGVMSGEIKEANFDQLTQVCYSIYGEEV